MKLKFVFNGTVITGEKIEKIWKDCIHFDTETFSSKAILTDINRIWIKLDVNTRELKIVGYPYKMASFNIKNIV